MPPRFLKKRGFMFGSPTLKDVEYTNDSLIIHHEQDTGLINYETQLIKENTDRGFSKGRHFQQLMRIPALEYIKLTAAHPELKDPDLMEKWVYTHDECAVYRIAERKRLSGKGMQLVVK